MGTRTWAQIRKHIIREYGAECLCLALGIPPVAKHALKAFWVHRKRIFCIN